ncbi:hypothetical protein AA12717_3733 [Gluconacetobacter sacchari DSM 12717]|uniref:UrcA family protein n=2 Tax=Gluconacetobacter sacchari TaxID=92759 RepID=A0A7W4NJJ6_9PROT|nr:hypothetical protein [Gluconacetobacter sacchari]MBB2158969.1 hypothetical protein [Gluconacetobacter sacchari]GBQ31343.1 hypothetical protein AA12717_3733 [Gluconacetobacter sacchari DSM 12717]
MFSSHYRSTRRLIATAYSLGTLLALSACGPVHVDGLPSITLNDDTSATAQPHLIGQFINDRIMSVPDTAANYVGARQNADAVDAALLELAEMQPSDAPTIRTGLNVCISREEAALHASARPDRRLAALRHEACAKGLAADLRPKRT